MFRHSVVIIAGLVLLAGCSAPLGVASVDDRGGAPQVDTNGTAPDDAETTATANATTIAVSATGEAEAPPDRAVVRFAVTATEDTADAARGSVAADVERVRTALRDAGVPDDAVRTTSFAVFPEYDVDRNGSRELVGYRAVHAFAVETAPENAGSVVDTVLSNGADEVESVAFELSDGTRAELRSAALDRAVSAARADAETVAAAADLTVTGVRAVEVDAPDRPGPVFAVREEASGTTFDPAPVTVTATVRMTYTAE